MRISRLLIGHSSKAFCISTGIHQAAECEGGACWWRAERNESRSHKYIANVAPEELVSALNIHEVTLALLKNRSIGSWDGGPFLPCIIIERG